RDRARDRGAVDRGLAEPARRPHALAQPDDARERIDHPKPLARGPGDQQTTIIGAKIERRIGRPGRSMAGPALGARMARWPAPTPRRPSSRLPSVRGVKAGRSPGLVVHSYRPAAPELFRML